MQQLSERLELSLFFILCRLFFRRNNTVAHLQHSNANGHSVLSCDSIGRRRFWGRRRNDDGETRDGQTRGSGRRKIILVNEEERSVHAQMRGKEV